jgi:hypothetical protein
MKSAPKPIVRITLSPADVLALKLAAQSPQAISTPLKNSR